MSGGPALDVDYCYLPADMEHGVGGDWYDVIPLPRDRVALVVGDVVGHGIAAAAAMGRLRIALHTLADMDLPPAVLLSRLDRTVVRLAQEKADHADLAVPSLAATCLYVVYDPIERLLDVTRAGHPPPVVVDPAGRATVPEVPAGVPIGLGVGLYESARMKIPDGTLIALYTDGLVESRSEDIESAYTVSPPPWPIRRRRSTNCRRKPSPPCAATHRPTTPPCCLPAPGLFPALRTRGAAAPGHPRASLTPTAASGGSSLPAYTRKRPLRKGLEQRCSGSCRRLPWLGWRSHAHNERPVRRGSATPWMRGREWTPRAVCPRAWGGRYAKPPQTSRRC
ncbi:serine/threonine-protein phosphatase [Streptomyces sp. T1317-0309]|nr:serine/threonine-protein phosphatase [Streptomyces sp. T1317-0309]